MFQKSQPSKKSKPARICILMRGQGWESPQEGAACKSRRHAHMTRDRVEAMIGEGKMEWVAGCTEVDGERVAVWIPVARFTMPRQWRKKISAGFGAPVAVMQLVP